LEENQEKESMEKPLTGDNPRRSLRGEKKKEEVCIVLLEIEVKRLE